MRCCVCNSEVSIRKKYDRHVLSIKALIKEVLPYFNFLIPHSIPSLKMFSNRSPLFRGFVGICGRCGHGEMEDPPTREQLQEYYQGEYWSRRSEDVTQATAEGGEALPDPRAHHQIDLVLQRVPCAEISSVLEIGAGAAFASLLLRDRCGEPAIRLFACEPGRQWESHYRRRGVKKIADYFPFEARERFSYVHTSHWLEHVLDLDETVAALRAILATPGYVFVEVPNTEHFYWELPTVDLPHIHFFTRQSLVRAFEKRGFECLSIGEYGLTTLDKQQGVSELPDCFGAREKGFWIRGLFRMA
jgi:SAM-dependent methyltransferase